KMLDHLQSLHNIKTNLHNMIPTFRYLHLTSLTSQPSLLCLSMTRWLPTTALSLPCWIGPSLSSGKLSVLLVDALLILKAPTSKPFWFAFGKASSTPVSFVAFCSSIPCS